ncbi:MAG: transglycosylase domain-containing protein, partial [Dehalococcoidia bacterium]|nr:transglycosylase domain-containing protein [Dehalococcoidia bacterium]
MSHRNSSTRLTSIARAIRHQTVSSERSINPVLIVVAIAFSLILLVGIAVTVSGATYAFNRYTEIAKGVIPPEELIANLPQGGARIYDRNGSLMYEFVDEFTGLRRPVQLENISHWLIEATLAVEDPTFYENNGLNTKGLVRATIENLTPYGGDFLEGSGGSSITQQLAKNVYIPIEERAQRTIDRKARETVIAIELTEQYTKEEILGWYLNSISYGGIYTGIEAASQGYFNKTASELTIAEAALLAGIPQSPGLYYPFHFIDLQTSQLIPGSPPIVRQHQVLNLMTKRGLISEVQANNAKTP